MKQRMIFLIIGLFGLLLLGCRNETAVSPPAPLIQVPTMIATQTPIPNPTLASTPVPTLTQTKQVNSTLPPTRSKTPTPLPTPVQLDLLDIPSWVTDPEINTFLIEVERGNNTVVSIINAHTVEYFDIPLNENTSVLPSWVWRQGALYIQIYYPQSTGSVNRDAYKELINLTTGEVSNSSVDYTNGTDVESSDGRFTISVLEEANSPPMLTMVDVESGNVIELFDPFAGSFPDRIDFAWSPITSLIVVERVRFIEDEEAFYGVRAESAIAIYDASGTIIYQLRDLTQRGFSWSTTEPFRLLLPGSYSLGSETPCIVEIRSQTYLCLSEITTWANERGVEYGLFEWSPDSTKVSFVYWDLRGGGFCYFELANKQITCPATWNDLQIEEYIRRFATGDRAPVFVTDYEWAPSGEFVALFINPNSPKSDDRTMQTVSIISLEDKSLKFVGDSFSPRDNPWRPNIP